LSDLGVDGIVRGGEAYLCKSPDNSLSLMESSAVDQLVGSRADVASALLGAAEQHATVEQHMALEMIKKGNTTQYHGNSIVLEGLQAMKTYADNEQC
jgi:hypothetical protein